NENQMRFLITKGVPDVVLPRCTYWTNKETSSLLKPKDQAKIDDAIDKMADKALRTIAISMKPLKKGTSLNEEFLEKDLNFIGLYGMMDPRRKEVKAAIRECKEAGIKTVMITGDHAKTDQAIEKDLEVLTEDGLVLEGRKINKMFLDELKKLIE